MNYSHLVQDTDWWRDLVNMTLNLWVLSNVQTISQMAEELLASEGLCYVALLNRHDHYLRSGKLIELMTSNCVSIFKILVSIQQCIYD